MKLAMLLIVLGWSAMAQAQVIFEPVQYQHGMGRSFYYGGTDEWVRGFGYRQLRWTSGAVYLEGMGYRDASIYGYSANDASNEAYANATRYFRKGDLIRSGVIEEDGTISVRADVKPRRVFRATMPVEKGVILIIPKGARKSDNLLVQNPSTMSR